METEWSSTNHRSVPIQMEKYRISEVPAKRNSGPPGKEKMMVNTESWRISIEQAAAYIESQIGVETVSAVFAKYYATSIEDLHPCYYSEAYNELSAIEADLRN